MPRRDPEDRYWDEVDEMRQKEKDGYYDHLPESEQPGWYVRAKRRRKKAAEDRAAE